MLDTVTWEMVNLMQSDGCLICQWDQDTDNLTVVADYETVLGDDSDLDTPVVLSDFAVRKRVLQERFAQQVNLDEADAVERAFMERRDVKSVLFLPMAYQERVVGLVVVMQMR